MSRLNLTDENINKKLRIAALVLIIILISWPFLFMDLAKGHDMLFHLQRIEGIRQDVSLRHFPVRMQSGWMRGYGYPVSILYGDVFLYIGAVFRKLGFPVMVSFRLFMVCVNTAAVLISYFSFKVFNKGWAPVIATAAYTTSSYRLVDEYVRSAIGETLAIVFFPAVAACIYLILTTKDYHRRRKYTVVLSLSFLAVICSHTLTTSMMLVVLVLFGPVSLVLFGIKGERIRQMGNVVMAGILTILMSAFFVIPFLDTYLNAGIAFALKRKNSIQGEGPEITDLFEFVCNPFGGTNGGSIQQTPGPVLICFLIIAIVACIVSVIRKIDFPNRNRIVFETVASLILLLMSSAYFPWNFIEDNVPVLGGILTAIEFPMRYLAFAIVFMALLTGDMIRLIGDRLGSGSSGITSGCAVKAVCIVIMCALFIFNVAQICFHSRTYEKRADYKNVEDMGEWRYYAMDFRLENTTVDDLPTGLVHEGMLSMEVLSRDSNEFLIACVTGPDYGWIQLPVFNYPYYHAADLENPKMEFEIHDGGNRTVGVLLPANYEGILHVYWQEPVFWRVSEVVSYITFALCILYLLAISDKDNGIKRIYNRLSKNGTDKEYQK